MSHSTHTQAMLGALVADAVAMPVHWYYNTEALDRDYGQLEGYAAPKNPHPDSILWRSRYTPRNPRGDILRGQAAYWGQRGIHYHQFLSAGENTINYQLASELFNLILEEGTYHAPLWAQRYIDRMLQDGWHRDTYLEEYHRAFFDNYAQGGPTTECGIDDIHIGGLSQIPSLLAGLQKIGITELKDQLSIVETHVELTHRNHQVKEAAASVTQILHHLANGLNLKTAMQHCEATQKWIAAFANWESFPVRTVVGRHLSTACYLPESFQASLFLCWKYADDFSGGILANAHCGGDNCHRGAVVGALLGAANRVPEKWLKGLQAPALLNLRD